MVGCRRLFIHRVLEDIYPRQFGLPTSSIADAGPTFGKLNSMRPSRSTRWQDSSGQVIACTEKIKVLNENLDELRQMAQDALEDGILMGCCERQLRDALAEAVGHLVNPYSAALPDSNVIGKSPC